MIIIGLTGDIESGKTTVADYMADALQPSGHWESWQVIAEIAAQLRTSAKYPKATDLQAINHWLEPLPAITKRVVRRDIAADALEITAEKLQTHPEDFEKLLDHLRNMAAHPDQQTVAITAQNKEIFRSLLQWLGGYLIKITDEGLWYDEILRRVRETPQLALATIGGVRFPGESDRIQAAGGYVMRIVRPELQRRDASDLTERLNKQINVNATITNDASLAALRHCARAILDDIQSHNLKPVYTASAFIEHLKSA